MKTITLSLKLAAMLALPGMSLAQNTFPTTGNVGIGTTNPLDALNVVSSVTSAYRGNVALYDSSPVAAGIGGQINFGGKYSGTDPDSYTEWAGIQGSKANSVDGHLGGRLEFRTRLHGQFMTTKMVLDDLGNVGIGTTSPYADATLEVLKGNRSVLVNPTFGGVESGGMLALSRTNDGAHSFFIGVSAAPAIDQVIYGQGGLSEMRFMSAEEGFGFYHVISIPEAFAGSRPPPLMKISRSGNVGIGTATPQAKLDVNGKINCTVLELTSDRNQKKDFAAVDSRHVLEQLLGLPILTWAYTNDAQVRRIGPMAQDWKVAYPELGSDDKHIATVDADGVIFAALQGLNLKLEAAMQEKDARIAALEQKLAQMEALANRIAAAQLLAPSKETP